MLYEPALRYFRAFDSLLGRVERRWWGAAVTDGRFPHLYDVNYARVETSDPDLTLEEVEDTLRPMLREVKAGHLHTVLFDPDAGRPLLRSASRRGDRISWDTAMEYRGVRHLNPAGHEVDLLGDLDASFWATHRAALRELGVSDERAAEQLGGLARDVQVPAGCRWFAVRIGGDVAGVAALQVHGGVGYLDDVVTFPPHRRRGVAGALVTHAVGEARASGADPVFLLADEPDPIRLYGSLGFVETGRLVSTLATVQA